MTKAEIEDYLYFFWAPLRQAGAVSDEDMGEFKKRIILTLSQAAVYIEAPEYKAERSSREYSDDIKNEINEFAYKIFANIPARTTDNSYWLNITVSALIPLEIISTDTLLTPDISFGPYEIAEDRFIVFDFYYLPHQLQIKLPTATEISAVISSHTPIEVPDGAVTKISIDNCTLWLSAIHFDAAVIDPAFYISVRLKQCNIEFDGGYTKTGDKITPGLFDFHIGFVVTCIPENEIHDGAATTVAAGNTVIYPNTFVFKFKHRLGLPQPPKITFTQTKAFSATLFGSAINTLPASAIKASWIADKKLLLFPLQTESDSFSATDNSAPVFDLKGEGKMNNVGWYFPVVSINHPLALGRLGLASETGYIGFDVNDEFLLSWKGLENGPVKLNKFFLLSSPDTLSISYTANPAMLARQQLKLWKRTENKKGRSGIKLDFVNGGTGSFISHRKNNEIHATNAHIDVDIDRPLLSKGDKIFLKTSGVLMFLRDDKGITAIVTGVQMDPADDFENSAFRQLSSFVLSNALILVNPVQIFLLAGNLDATDAVAEGICHISFPVTDVEHILPDPYISSVFNEQPGQDDRPNSARRLKVIVRWSAVDAAALSMELVENDDAPKPTEKLTDEKLADLLLSFPLPHPAAKEYEELLRDTIGESIDTHVEIITDQEPFRNYQSLYHSKKNTTGAFYMLHILPGNVSLVDVSGRVSQMGIAFSRNLRNTENGIRAVLDNTGYTSNHTYRIENNELVSSGWFVRAFTLPHVQWEPVYFEEKESGNISFDPNKYFPAHGVPTRIASSNKANVALTPVAITKYIVEGFQDEKNKYAAAAHFALPFGMNAVALFHPYVDDVKSPTIREGKIITKPTPDPYSYSIVKFNQPHFNLKKGVLSGAIQIKITSEGLPKIPRDEIQFPDPSFHGAVLQMPNGFTKLKVVNGIVEDFNDDSILGDTDSILGDTITKQFNRVMWGEYKPQGNGLVFVRSANAKVPLRRIDFSGFGASIFSNWLYKNAKAGTVSQVKFNILIGRVAHEVVQIKSCIVPYFVPVVRTIIIERKNHGNVIRTDSGWVATGPGVFHRGYTCHPGVIKGVYNVTSIKDTKISIPHKLRKPDENGKDVIVDMAGIYFDADVKIENVISGFINQAGAVESNYKLVSSKKQFGYILLGNPANGVELEAYFTPEDFRDFMLRSDVGALGGPVDCVVNIAGSDQMMHVTRADVTATASTLFVAAAKGTLHLPKGGSWSVVKKITNGATQPLTKDETVPLIRNGILQFDSAGNPTVPDFKNSLHVLGNPLEIGKYAAGLTALADTEYALLQSTGTQKLLFPRPSFDSGNMEVVDGITRVKPEILVTDPVIADPYSLIKSNSIFPDSIYVLSLKNAENGVQADRLNILREKSGISFPDEIANALKDFVPPECIPVNGESRKLRLVDEESFKIYIDYGVQILPDGKKVAKQLFTAALNGDDDNNRWKMMNKEVAIIVELGPFKPLLIVKGDFTAEPGAKPKFDNAKIEWGPHEDLKKIIEVLTILYMLSSLGQGSSKDIIKRGFSFVMGNSSDSWNYKCSIEEIIPAIKFPDPVLLAQLPGPAPLIVEAGLNLGIFFNLSLSADPNNPIKAGAGVLLGFEATIQVLLITIEAITAYGVGTAKMEVFIEMPEAKPTFKFTMGFGATVAVQLPMVGYVSLTRVISLGVSIDNGTNMTVGQMLRGVITIGGGLASVSVQVEASGTVIGKNVGTDKSKWTAIVRGVFTLDVTVAFVLSWDFSKDFEHEIDLPDPSKYLKI